MIDRDEGKVERMHRVTFPTASFSLTTGLIRWIAERSAALGISKSEFVRDTLEQAKREHEREAVA